MKALKGKDVDMHCRSRLLVLATHRVDGAGIQVFHRTAITVFVPNK